jgi:hypothetical protein
MTPPDIIAHQTGACPALSATARVGKKRLAFLHSIINYRK